jgi:hypothetical protein
MTLIEIVNVLRREHKCAGPCTEAQLDAARRRGLSEDLISFYAQANGATLFRSRPSRDFYTGEPNPIRFEFIIPPIDDDMTIAEVGFIDEAAPLYQASRTWRVVCDLGDGDHLAIETIGDHRGRVIDCDHEQTGWPHTHVILAPTFTAALTRLLAEEPFTWRDESPARYGTLQQA